jgi:PPK2 family polyphosphate:nucleotide phosphotransferase
MPFARLLAPGERLRLKDVDPGDTAGLDKEQGTALRAKLGEEFTELQQLLYAAGNVAVLVVLQGRDTSGKDGAIRRILDYANIQSCEVAAFKVPTPEELSRDFLWRIHKETPPRGGITIFNRSHYEDVLVVRVHDLAPKSVWEPRYDHINAFEKLLTDSRTLVLKFFLHISKEEQERRLLDREEDITKSWKLNVADWKDREHWDDYTKAYEDVLDKCSTPHAPWRIVSANKKWFRDCAILEAIVEELRPYRDEWMKTLEERALKAGAEVRAFRESLTPSP